MQPYKKSQLDTLGLPQRLITLITLLCASTLLLALEIQPLAMPEGNHARLPTLAVDSRNQLFMAWVEGSAQAEQSLRLSRWRDGQWSNIRTIEQGRNWLLNAVDPPGLHILADDQMLAHWIERMEQGHGTLVRMWGLIENNSAPRPAYLHDDRRAVEHGLVSSVQSNDAGWLFWLGGKPQSAEPPNSANTREANGNEFTARTALFARSFDSVSGLGSQVVLDQSVCECCGTDAARTDEGLILVYRDRSAEDVRDISYIRRKDGHWLPQRKVHEDNWRLTGCPMNAPAVAARGNHVAVVWYTRAKDQPQLLLARSSNAGEEFVPPMRLDFGAPIGQADVTWLDKQIFIVWREMRDNRARLAYAIVSGGGEKLTSGFFDHAPLHRRLGTPVLATLRNEIFVVWTRAGYQPKLAGLRILLNSEVPPGEQ